MRRHNRHARLSPRIDGEAFHHVVQAEFLVSARLDPGFAFKMDSEGTLDLAFARDGKIVLVPSLLVQAVMLLMRENSPYVWPAWIPPLREKVAREIEERIDPWLKSLMVGRFANDQRFELFGEDSDARELAERARAFGFFGAAPTEPTIRAIAPYVYAQRFARGRRVCIRDRDGASGAAMLARVAESVEVDLLDVEVTAVAKRWFGLEIFGASKDGASFDVAIGARESIAEAPVRIYVDGESRTGERSISIATPIPTAVMVSFDPNDGAAMRVISAAAPAAPVRKGAISAPAVVGGSSGRIALVLRSDYLGNDDADSDAARALALRLNEQGFSATLVPANHLRPSEYDLLHVFGMRAALDVSTALQGASSRPPLVVTPYADDPRREAAWGAAIAHSTLSNAPDDAQRKMYFDAMRDRRIAQDGLPKAGEGGVDPRAALALAGAAIAASEEEERRLHDDCGVRVSRIVAAVLAPEPDLSLETGSIAGLDDFIFVHAPVEARCNQYAVVRAAAELGYPIVLAGSVQDTPYYGEVMEALGDLGMWLGSDQLTEAELGSLYARCRVFVDASWSSGGLYRLLRAGAAGAALVAPASGFARGAWPGLTQIVDPGSMENIREGVRDAWQRAPEVGPATAARTAEIADPFKSLVGVLAAYQLAAQPISSQT